MQVYLLDAHSMKSKGNSTTPDGPGALRADMVIGDLDGTSCCPAFTELVREALMERGYKVKVMY
jgi:N-formylglutamate deformylase